MAKTAFVFPGQASQYVGMGLDVYNKSKIVSNIYDYAEKLFDFSLKNISFYGPITELTKTNITQPAIFTNSIAIFEELKDRGFKPDVVAGHSLGEYSALVASEVLTFEEGIELVKVRSEQMQYAAENSEGSMAAIVGMDYDRISKVLAEKISGTGICTIANHNSPTQIVISGQIHAVQSAMLELKNAGAKRAIELTVGGAFHSPLMEKAREKLKKTLDNLNFKKALYPIYSNVTGMATSDPEIIRKNLYLQLTSPVLWVDTIMNMIKEDDVNKFVEIGPGKVLCGLIRRIEKSVEIQGVSDYEDLENYS